MSDPYAMKVPCDECPFRREGGIRLSPKRVREVAGNMLDFSGGEFPCHKTVNNGSRDVRREVHCAGALIFAEMNGVATQMMRIAARLGMYEPGQFREEAKALVFDDLGEMLAVHKWDQRR